MTTSRVPDLIDALYTRATAALVANTAVQVLDGYGTDENPGDCLMIGVEDPASLETAFSGSSSQTPGPFSTNRKRDENGSVTCAAYSWNGNADQKQARDAAYSYVAAVENLLRSDPNLGIASGGDFVAQMGDTQRFSQNQTADGADALVVFNVMFFARI